MGGLGRKRGWCFWGGWYPNAHYESFMLFTTLHFHHAEALQHYIYIYIPPLTDFQNTITVTKLLMKRLSEKICNKNECHEAKLVSIFPMNFFVKRNKFVSSISSILGTSLFRRKIGSIISICLKLGQKGIKDVK